MERDTVGHERIEMTLKTLQNTPPWDWPEGTGKVLLDILRDPPTESDLLTATELAGDFTVFGDELVHALLCILRSDDKAEKVRGRAAISLGAVLEHADIKGFEDADDLPITEGTFDEIQESLRRLYRDPDVPVEVRRRILETAVRAPQDCHQQAIRAAYSGDDGRWRVTAVFCMRFVRGFEAEILEGLDSASPDVRYEAVAAAGSWALDAAWPHIAALVTSEATDKPMLLAAIEAVATIRPQEAVAILDDLLDSDDEDVVEAVHEAMAMVEHPSAEDDDDDPLH